MSIGTDEAEAHRIIHEALDLGINFLDTTADLYDQGRNEEITGRALKGRRSDVVLATKVGNRIIPGQDGWVWDASKAYISRGREAELTKARHRLYRPLSIAWRHDEDPIDDTIEAFETLKEQGWIRWYGISSIRPNVIREYVKRSNIVSVMNQYSIVDRRAEEEVIPLLAEHKISIIARGPVAKGILTDNGEHKAEGGFLDYSKEELLELRSKLKQLSACRSLTHTALRYTMDNETVAVTLAGASSLQQLRENACQPATLRRMSEECAAIQAISKANRYTMHR